MDRLHCVTALCNVFIETCIDPSAVFNYHPFMGCWIQLGRRWWFAGRHSSLAFGYLFGCCDHPIDTQGKSETWSRSSRYSIFGRCFFFSMGIAFRLSFLEGLRQCGFQGEEKLLKKIKKETKKNKTKCDVTSCVCRRNWGRTGRDATTLVSKPRLYYYVCVCVCGLSINIIKWLVKNKYDDNLQKLSR